MRIYTDTMSYMHLTWALDDIWPESPNVHFDHSKFTETLKARKRARRYDVALYGIDPRHTRRRNPGTSTDRWLETEYAATWMDWGWFIAVLLRHEPTAIVGQYDGWDDFIEQTSNEGLLAHRLKVDQSLRSFRRDWNAHWDLPSHGSPFALVDTVCPPSKLVNLNNPKVVSSWLETA